MHRLICGALFASMPSVAAAHGASGLIGDGLAANTPGGTGTGWIITALAAAAMLYSAGVIRLWRASGPGRGLRLREGLCFIAGLALLAIALLGTLDTVAARSFAAHMVQHEVLMLIAAPLLVMGRPLAVWAWALPFGPRKATRAVVRHPGWRRCWRFATRPFGATLLQVIALLVWHIPAAFDRASTHAGLHALQHATFVASALCFWWALRVSVQRGERDARAAAIGMMALFCTMIVTGAFGALLTFAPTPWYHVRAEAPAPWAASALEDQQLGGLIMWVPGGTVYLIAALMLARRLLLRADVVKASPASMTVPYGVS